MRPALVDPTFSPGNDRFSFLILDRVVPNLAYGKHSVVSKERSSRLVGWKGESDSTLDAE